MPSPENALSPAAEPLAAAVLNVWDDERRVRNVIVRLFEKCFVQVDGLVRSGAHGVTFDDLSIVVAPDTRTNDLIGRGRRVTVVNARFAGDNPLHRRVFTYWDRSRIRQPEPSSTVSWGEGLTSVMAYPRTP
jgi:hypothetical protein